MPLTQSQIAALLNEARAAGLDPDEVAALEWVLQDRAAELDGATRLDLSLMLADEVELRAADQFMVEAQALRRQALERGIADLNSMSNEEWERLINAD